jgi:hypothetical protein
MMPIAAFFALAVGYADGAAAAPQVLALLSTDGPVPLACKDGLCQATLSALCLQKDRQPPASGQLYDPARAEHLSLVVTDAKGRTRHVPAQGLRIESERTFVAVRFVLPESTLAEWGGVKVALAVSKGSTLVPRAVANDVNPQTPADIAHAVTVLREQAGLVEDAGDARGNFARMAARFANVLPRSGPIDKDAARAAHKMISEANAGRPGQARFQSLFNQCDVSNGMSLYGRNMRECVQHFHDRTLTDLNHELWNQVAPGS